MIVLNGVGSVGKSSTIRSMQAISSRPFLHVSMDVVIAMLPERMLGHPDGLVFEPGLTDGRRCIAVKAGSVMATATRGMRHARSLIQDCFRTHLSARRRIVGAGFSRR